MEESKKRIVIIPLAIVVVIVIASVGVYLFKGEASVEGITAMENRDIADEIAQEWNSSAILVSVSSGSELSNDGRGEAWYYTYSSNNPDRTSSVGYSIKILKNTSDEAYELEHPPSYIEIEDWNIDSNEALEIGRADPTLKEWEYYERITHYSMGIRGSTDGPYWFIVFVDSNSGLSISHEYNMWIDATTGEVISS